MKIRKECPKCGFEGLMTCVCSIGAAGKKYICPNCHYMFENLKGRGNPAEIFNFKNRSSYFPKCGIIFRFIISILFNIEIKFYEDLL